MPKPPGILDRVNAIVRFIEDPCLSLDAPWLLYIELARKPAGLLIVALLTFGLDDVIRGYFRPKGLRSGRHGRRRRAPPRRPGALRRALRRIPGLGDDVGDMLGKRLPGAERMRGRQVKQGVKFLWIVDGLLQRVLFWWLIIDLTTQFLYDWSSLIQQTDFCKAQQKSMVYAAGTGGGAAAIANWEAISSPFIIKQRGSASWISTSGSVGSGNWTVIVGYKWQSLSSFDQKMSLRLRDFAGGQTVRVQEQSETVKSGETGEMIMSGDFEGPGLFVIEQRITTGFSVGTEIDVWIGGGD